MMKKSELKTGMRAQYRNGEIKFVYITDCSEGYFTNANSKHTLISSFNDDLFNDGDDEFDIVKVYDVPKHPYRVINLNELGGLLWERKEEEEKTILTLDDVEYSESTLRSLIKKATS